MINFIWIIFVVQTLIGIGIFMFLKKLLDCDLQELALEKLQNLSFDCKEIKVITHKPIKDVFKSRVEKIIQQKNVQVSVEFSELSQIKGGMIIEAGAQTIDCSLLSRLKNFW